MAQYIDKSALVAEIERKINEINLDNIEDWRNRIQREHDIEVMKRILSLIDTLEVKEEVLDKNDKTKLMQKCVHKAYKRGYDMGVLLTTNEMNHNVKEVDTWHLQENENIYDAVKDWNLHTFACVMKDGTIQKFIGNMDEDYEGHINIYICGANDDYNNVDDIVKWIEFT